MLSRRAVPGTALQPSRPQGTTLPRLAHSPRFVANRSLGAVSGHDDLHRPGLRPSRSPGAVPGPAAPGSGRLPGPDHGAPPGSTPNLTCAVTCPGAPSAACPRGPPGGRTWAVHPMDAGDPPLQALHRVAAVLGRGRVLQDLRHRRPARALTGRARPAARGPPESPALGF